MAMACLYTGYFGIKEISDIAPNQSSKAVRMNLAPIHKFKILLCNLLSSIFVNAILIGILLLYLICVLKIDFGDRVLLVILTNFVGIITGIFMGGFIGSIVKKKEETKVAVYISTTMFCVFLAGMMAVSIKYWIREYLPFVSYINPANLITDAFYSLYYYESLNRFWLNIGILSIISAIFLALTFCIIRRQKYESI
jgi:ABC-2 type transport system permease protein